MINTWQFNIICYFIVYIIFTQFFKLATKTSKNDGALTVVLQFCSGLVMLLFIPLFNLQFPQDIRTYIFLGIACVFYAITDRLNTTARRGLEVSVHSILSNLTTVLLVVWGIVIFKEEIIIKKIIGALLIVLGNVIVLYQKRKFEWNKYVIFSLLRIV